MRRVVVTGMGLVSPLGGGIKVAWDRLVRGHSGISRIEVINNPEVRTRIAGQLPDDVPLPTLRSHTARFVRLAVAAATEAVRDSGWHPARESDLVETGVYLGSGCGGLETWDAAALDLRLGYEARTTDAFIHDSLVHEVSSVVAEHFGFMGPRRAVATACAAGVHALGDAARMIAFGDANVMIAGGTEAPIFEMCLIGFGAARALSTGFNDRPTEASRPWDRDRDGFVMGEGSAVLVLEAYNHARARGARIHAEVAGYGLSGDAHHITAPPEGHAGAVRSMRSALRHARLSPSEVQYVNAHGTSTPMGDDMELEAVETVFGSAAEGLMMSSTKSATGHMLGAAGAAEAIFSILALRDGIAPPTLNLHAPSRDSVIDRVPLVARERPIRAALSNSFGFGGTNASVVLRAV